MSAQKTTDRPLSHQVAESLDTYFQSAQRPPAKQAVRPILCQVEPPLFARDVDLLQGHQSKAADMLA